MAGPIQNEVNQLLGTAAVVAGGAKHFKGKEEENALEKDVEIANAKVKDAELKEQLHVAKKEMEQYKEDTKLLEEGKQPLGGGAYTFDIFGQNSGEDMKARKLALDTMKAKMTAMRAQRKAYAELITGGKK